MREKQLIIISIIITIGLFLLLFLWTPKPKIPNITMPWDSYISNNKVKLFGLTLEESTLKNAMQNFGTEVKASLFKTKNQKNTIEIYFDTKIGGLSAKIILILSGNQKIYNMLNQNIKNYKVMPSGHEKVEFSSLVNNQLIPLKIKNLSFIPNIKLKDKTIIARFGKPDFKTKDAWFYQQKGLKIVKSGELNIFEYSNDKNLRY